MKYWADAHWTTLLLFGGAVGFDNVGLAVLGSWALWFEIRRKS